jgi:hypothetical protein
MTTAAAVAVGVGSASSAGRFRRTAVPKPTTAASKPSAGFQKHRSALDSRDDHRRRRRCWRRVSDLCGPFSDDRCPKTGNCCFKTDRRFAEASVGFEIAAVGPASRDGLRRRRRCWLSDQCWPAGIGSVTDAAAARLFAGTGEAGWSVPDSGAGPPTVGPLRFQNRPPFPNRGPCHAGILDVWRLRAPKRVCGERRVVSGQAPGRSGCRRASMWSPNRAGESKRTTN